GADRVPVAGGDLAVVAAAGDPGRPALLLAAVDPVREPVVGDDVVELRRRLVVPTAPGLAAVDGDDRPLVGGDEDHVRVVGADPDGVVVVPAGGAADAGERLAGIGGAVERGVGNEDHVRVLRVHLDLGEVAAAAPEALLRVDPPPTRAGV